MGFVGTFDFRKGAAEFPALVDAVAKEIPDVSFHLYGTAGLFQTAEQVTQHFPLHLRTKLHIVPRFIASELPSLLAECRVGMFPSYLEGFPFGVLEMLASGLPVVAYDVPGPPEMVPRRWLVAPGDVFGMSAKIVELLKNPLALTDSRREAKRIAQSFTWESVARRTISLYTARLGQLTGRVRSHV